MSDPTRSTRPLPPANEPFAVHLDPRGGRPTLTGRPTRSTTHLLHDAVSAMLAADRDAWVIDVADADLGGGAALQAIGAAYRRLLRHGRRMTLTGAQGALHQQLTRLRLDHHVLPGTGPPTTATRPIIGP